MNPVVIIPSYWANPDDIKHSEHIYDHACSVDSKHPELMRCLSSLKGCKGLDRIIVLLVADKELEPEIRGRIEAYGAELELNLLVIDSKQTLALQEYLAPELDQLSGEPVSLRGYGAIKNVGLIAAAAFGHDVAVFLDDDEELLDEDFLIKAVYGLGQKTRQGLPLVAKSGYFIDRRSSCYADLRHVRWYDKKWAKRLEFNELMNELQSGSRIARSNILCGGCFALHAEAYMRVAFDPWITRGEDQDYLINLRLYGLDVWFDNKWSVRHLPPIQKKNAPRFMQNVYRWVYEQKKLEYARTKIDLQTVTSNSLMPYPGPWVGPELKSRIQQTALMRSIGSNERAAYFDIFLHAYKRALEYAELNCDKYLKLQALWPQMMQELWDRPALKEIFMGALSQDVLKDARLQQTDPQLLAELKAEQQL